MIVIADSGSTKTDWIVADNKLKITSEFTTKGLNPNATEGVVMLNVLNTTPEIQRISDAVQKVFFYGAGCGSPENAELMKELLSACFPSATITVKSDLYAAAYAAGGAKPGVICILGTGSNSCFYDGEFVQGENYNLGYVLGDEGSGCYFGKRLLRDYFYGILPRDLKEKFSDQYQLTRDELIQKVYHEPYANQFMASFVPFLKENIGHPYCNYLISFGLDEFLKIFVTTIPNFKLWPTHFVGSVANAFKEQLVESCKANRIVPGNILQSPIRDLLQYHIAMEKK